MPGFRTLYRVAILLFAAASTIFFPPLSKSTAASRAAQPAADQVQAAKQNPLPGPPRKQKLPQENLLNPRTLTYELPNQIHWTSDAMGAKTAVLLGDPSKPGLYIMLVKWTPHHMSHPHWHPNNRYITVISGTWWIGTGTKFDPNRTVAMPAGSFVTHFAKQPHYDGAKDQECVLEIVGDGPATATPAEEK
ncbi:MAG TPA: cupin domain-containing protein [Candidatus Acidoferrales bacterium]|nr:cupin domain-containing protein [Candidatus Acidoferrales bacterium]